jgi:hypothetical protein
MKGGLCGVSMVHGAATVVLVDRWLNKCCQVVMSVLPCSPTVLHSQALLVNMAWCVQCCCVVEAAAAASTSNGTYDTYHVYKKLRQCMHKQLLGDGVDVMIHCLKAGDVSVVRESTVAASAIAAPHHHITHHAMFTNSAWLCSTIGAHGKTLITTMDGVNNPSLITVVAVAIFHHFLFFQSLFVIAVFNHPGCYKQAVTTL